MDPIVELPCQVCMSAKFFIRVLNDALTFKDRKLDIINLTFKSGKIAITHDNIQKILSVINEFTTEDKEDRWEDVATFDEMMVTPHSLNGKCSLNPDFTNKKD